MKSLSCFLILFQLHFIAYSQENQNCTKVYVQENWGSCEEEKNLQTQNFKNTANSFCGPVGGVDWERTTYKQSQSGTGNKTSCNFEAIIICKCKESIKKKTKKVETTKTKEIEPPRRSPRFQNSFEALSWLKNTSNNDLVKGVCNTILVHWDSQKIKDTGVVGFWWHEKDRIVSEKGTNIVYCHAGSNSNLVPNGPWQLEVQFGRFIQFNKNDIRREFERAGYECEQDDGPNVGQGDKALSFHFKE
ncbi:hypothetical protein [Cyclobacterium sp. SYSU L10401]|uniref:hypothetical protein n=1 Tax=Cyclobacterium sp. SYSU L10401 TaxID=2678657 RepID=UPI001969BB54|nr:hypothetical protein [Cyclobacterium sp. SYSU L10401]